MCLCSHETEVLDAADFVVVGTHWLINVVSVRRVAGQTLLRRASLSLIDDLLANTDILLHHLDAVDMVNLNEMSRETVVEEVRWEHHTVASVPELGLILLVEVHDFTAACESESAEYHVSCYSPNEKTRVVQRSILQANKAREDGSLHAQSLVNHQPPVVHKTHHAPKRVATILALAHLKCRENAADRSTSLGEALVDEVLESSSSAKHPVLESLSHVMCFVIYYI